MSLVTDVGDAARLHLRDFPRYFEENFAPSARSTLRLPHPLVNGATLVVVDNAADADLDGALWGLDERNGLLKIPDPAPYTAGLTVQGHYYQWFLNADLYFFADFIVNETYAGQGGIPDQGSIPLGHREVLSIGVLVEALWSLMTEFSTDIDIQSPEGMSIPAHQRFEQVWQMLQYWQKRYEEQSALLGIGIYRIEQFDLRRVSYMTGRYVPMYREREVDDPRPPIRVFPPIPKKGPSPMDPYIDEEDMFATADTSSQDLGAGGGFFSLGTRG